jgi:hypothetical protein
MKPFPALLGASCLAALLAVSGCSGDDSPSGDPSPSSSASSASPTPTATPTPKPTRSPPGKYGVTVVVLNADRYGSDPVVRSWKANLEALAGSVNHKKLLPGLSRSVTGAFRHRTVQVLQQAWGKNWRAAKVQKVRVLSVSSSGRTARLVGCTWKPTTDYRDRAGKVIGGLSRKWDQVPFEFRRVGSAWKLDKADIPTGFCRLPPPQ